jgi:FAD/FMN-containing dehydrogenase
VEITDTSGYPGHATELFTPRDEEELAAILVRATNERVPVTIAGALTGMAGGAAPLGGWAVSMRNFQKLDVQESKARVGCGTLLRDVQAAAAQSGQFYAPDPTENTSSIGGNIAANASGSRSFKYGATRRHVRAVRVVWMDGRISEHRRGEAIDFSVPAIPLPRTTKHSAGYELAPGMDWVDLLIGSEGTLGVVTEAELQLLPDPGEILGGVVFFPNEDSALDAVERWRTLEGLRMLEYLDRGSLQIMNVPHAAALMIEIEGDAVPDMTGALEAESWFAASPADREKFRRFRHSLAEQTNDRIRRSGYTKVGTDYAVPVSRGRDILSVYRKTLERDLRIPYVCYGHIGDAHVHLNAFPSSPEEQERAKKVMNDLAHPVVEMGGTVGAEHGLGKRKAHLLSIQYKPDIIHAMLGVKRRFDPRGLLGAGTLLPAPKNDDLL